MCVVEVKGAKRLMTACTTPVAEGMDIETDSEPVHESRKKTLDFICCNHRMECEYCQRYTDCNLHELVRRMGLDDRKYILNRYKKEEITIFPSLIYDNSKCVQCRRCEAACLKQGMYTLQVLFRGEKTWSINSAPMLETDCVECGQCLAACPTGALSVLDENQKFWNALRVSGKQVIAVLDPNVYDSIGRSMHCNENAGEKLAWLLRQFGVKKVYPLAIPRSEIDNDLVDEVGKGVRLSADCPAAVRFIETRYPKFAEFLSDSTSIMERAARFCKDGYARSQSIDSKEVFCVVITPCIAAKPQVGEDIDLVLTTIELDRVIEKACVSRYTKLKVWCEAKAEPLDMLPGQSQCRSISEERVAALYGLRNIAGFLDSVSELPIGSGVIELFACEGGCEKGGGQLRNIHHNT